MGKRSKARESEQKTRNEVPATTSQVMTSPIEDTDRWVRLFLGEPDILRNILGSLPKQKDVLNCRLVCRQWMEEIEKDQDFWERMLGYGKTEVSKTKLLIHACKTGSPAGVAVYLRRGFDANASIKVIPKAPVPFYSIRRVQVKSRIST